MAIKARESISLFSTKEVYDEIYATKIRVGDLEANSVTTTYLTTHYLTATDIAATYATISTLQTDYLDAVSIAATYASISRVQAVEADVSDLQTNKLSADYATIINQNSDNISTINATVANKADINLLNTTLVNGQAIVTQAGYINNATITDLTADKLRVLGQDGIYYAINVTGGAVSAATAQADLNTYGTQLTGETLIDGTVVADKLFVNDLSAITGNLGEAHIGGLDLESSSIHSANKTSVATGTGMYMNSAGEMGLVGTNGALLFYDDPNDSYKRKLTITADSLFIGSTNMSTIANYAEKAVKTTIQLWHTKSNITAPAKPTSAVTSDSTDGNAWRVVVPTYNATYPYYFYCFQYKYNDDTYGWSDVVRDRATEESQSTSRTVSSSLANYITSNDTAIANLQTQIDGQIEAWYISGAPNSTAHPNQNDPALSWTTLELKKRHLGDLYFDVDTGHSWRYLATDDTDPSTFAWSQIPDSDASAALAAAQNAQSLANSKRRIFTSQPTVPYDVGDMWIDTVNGEKVIKYSSTTRSTGNYTASDWSVASTAVNNVYDEYAINTSPTTAPTTGWSTTVPTWQEGYYIWLRTVKTINGTSSTSDAVCITGSKGDDGYMIVILTSNGSVFKNSSGTTTLTARIYQGATELDSAGTSFTYSWQRWLKNGTRDTTFSGSGKTITVSASNVDEKSDYEVTVSWT